MFQPAQTKVIPIKKLGVGDVFRGIEFTFYAMGVNVLSEKQNNRIHPLVTFVHRIVVIATILSALHIFAAYGYAFVFDKDSRNKRDYFIVGNLLLASYFRFVLYRIQRDMSAIPISLRYLRSKCNIDNDMQQEWKTLLIVGCLVFVYTIASSVGLTVLNLQSDTDFKKLTRIMSFNLADHEMPLIKVIIGATYLINRLLLLTAPELFMVYTVATSLVIQSICNKFVSQMSTATDLSSLKQMHNHLTKQVQLINDKLNFEAFVSFVFMAEQTFHLTFDILFISVNFRDVLMVFLRSFQGIVDFLGLSLAGARIHESVEHVRKKAVRLDPDVFIRYPEVMMKLLNVHVYMTLWGLVNITRGFILTTVEIVGTYVIVIGTLR